VGVKEAGSVSEVSGALQGHYGAAVPLTAYFDTEPFEADSAATRWTDEGPIRAGQAIGYFSNGTRYWCTAGFGTSERTGTAKNGSGIFAHFVLTAGHCFAVGEVARRFHGPKDKEPNKIGPVTRRALLVEQDKFATDGEAIELSGDGSQVPQTIVGEGTHVLPVNGVEVAKPGMVICGSGATTDKIPKCKAILGPAEVHPGWELKDGSYTPPFYVLHTYLLSEEGDSGGPIWSAATGKALGLNVGGGSGTEWFIPLLPPPLSEKGLQVYEQVKRDKAPGLLNAPTMGNMHIVTTG
ncbi:MAG: hypothetical protein ACRD4I_18580, partial [Candidatus Angelobacter sp.]